MRSLLAVLILYTSQAYAQPPRTGRAGADSGCVILQENLDLTASVDVFTPRGRFFIQTDSITLAAFADSAAVLRPPTAGHGREVHYASVRLATFDSTQQSDQAIQIVRLKADSATPYEIAAGNGAWSGGFVMSFDSARARSP